MTTKNLVQEKIKKLPEKDIRIVAQFLYWLEGERLTKSELEAVKRGKAEIDCGEFVEWRNVGKLKV